MASRHVKRERDTVPDAESAPAERDTAVETKEAPCSPARKRGGNLTPIQALLASADVEDKAGAGDKVAADDMTEVDDNAGVWMLNPTSPAPSYTNPDWCSVGVVHVLFSKNGDPEAFEPPRPVGVAKFVLPTEGDLKEVADTVAVEWVRKALAVLDADGNCKCVQLPTSDVGSRPSAEVLEKQGYDLALALLEVFAFALSRPDMHIILSKGFSSSGWYVKACARKPTDMTKKEHKKTVDKEALFPQARLSRADDKCDLLDTRAFCKAVCDDPATLIGLPKHVMNAGLDSPCVFVSVVFDTLM